MAKRDYLVEAAKQIRMALDSEVNEDYEAAFSYYKNGVDLLLNGVQCKWTFGFKGSVIETLGKTCDESKNRKQDVKNELFRRVFFFFSHKTSVVGCVKGLVRIGCHSFGKCFIGVIMSLNVLQWIQTRTGGKLWRGRQHSIWRELKKSS